MKNILKRDDNTLQFIGQSVCGTVSCPPQDFGIPDEKEYSETEIERYSESNPIGFKLLTSGENIYVAEEGSKVIVDLSLQSITPTKLRDRYGLPRYCLWNWWIPRIDGNVGEIDLGPSNRRLSRHNDSLAALKGQEKVLEWLFPAGWFSDPRNKTHPAFIRHQTCDEQIARESGIPTAEKLGDFATVARLRLDSTILILVSEGDLKSIVFGSLDSFGDETVRKKIQTRVTDPRMFEDMMVELYTAAWHKSKHHSVTPLEIEGLPDMIVKVPSLDLPIAVECKHVTSDSENRIDSVIKKASNQIGNFKSRESRIDAYGVVMLDFASSFGVNRVKSNLVPERVQRTLDLVKRSVSGNKNNSVKTVVCTWDDYLVLGDDSQPTAYVFRRNFRVVHHDGDFERIPQELLFEGFTGILSGRLQQANSIPMTESWQFTSTYS
ncbi:MAG: hypothetical protein ABSB53_00025 [Nitrososphaerales archaeon]